MTKWNGILQWGANNVMPLHAVTISPQSGQPFTWQPVGSLGWKIDKFDGEAILEDDTCLLSYMPGIWFSVQTNDIAKRDEDEPWELPKNWIVC